MADIPVYLNSAGIRQVLTSGEVQRLLLERAERIAAAAGEGMEASVESGRNRARASVITATTKARLAEAKDRALTRALDAGR
jgi:hypothetical protein